MLTQKTTKIVSDGKWYPLGATLIGEGVNFALYSKHASDVFLLLFDRPEGEPTDIIQLSTRTKYVWHACVQGVQAGQLYGFKVCGPFKPAEGLRFNERKLLMDPYAKALTGKFRNMDNLLLAYGAQAPDKDLSQDLRDNTRMVPKSIVVDDRFDWQGDTPPAIPF